MLCAYRLARATQHATAADPCWPRLSRSRTVLFCVQAPDCKHGAKKIKVGVCAMDKKVRGQRRCQSAHSSSVTEARRRRPTSTAVDPSSCPLCWLTAAPVKAQSKPMCEILARLTAGGEFEVVLFGDKVSSCCLSALS